MVARVVRLMAACALIAGGGPGYLTRLHASEPYRHGDPTAEEQFMLELINRSRADPVAEALRFGIDLNEGIAGPPVSPLPKQPLAFNAELLAAARDQSRWMIDTDVVGHVRPDGTDPAARMRTAGYEFTGAWTFGENIAFAGLVGATPPVGPTVARQHEALFVDADFPGRGHRVFLMNGSFREIGIGVGVGVFRFEGEDLNAVIATQDFAASGARPGPFLVGVVFRDADGDAFYTPGEGLGGITVTPENGPFHAITSTSGGYAIPLGNLAGTITVRFSGGPLTTPATRRISLAGVSLKLDLEVSAAPGEIFGFQAGSPRFLDGTFEAAVFGPADSRLAVEASSDLVRWDQVTALISRGSPILFREQAGAGTGPRFYRVRRL